MTKDAGIDYGMGLANIDKENGIRYGVINSNEVLQRWADSSEAQYSPPPYYCPNCDTETVVPSDSEELSEEDKDIVENDYFCPSCKQSFWSDRVSPENPMEYTYTEGGYKCLQTYDDSDIFVIKSPYYTLCSYCSPCAPGAGYLTSTNENGIKAYCLGHDWFDEDIAPYPVFRVEDDRQVVAERKEVVCSMCHGDKVRDTGQLAEIRNEPIETTEEAIVRGDILIRGFDPEKHTFECSMCFGKGTREEVVERVIENVSGDNSQDDCRH